MTESLHSSMCIVDQATAADGPRAQHVNVTQRCSVQQSYRQIVTVENVLQQRGLYLLHLLTKIDITK